MKDIKFRLYICIFNCITYFKNKINKNMLNNYVKRPKISTSTQKRSHSLIQNDNKHKILTIMTKPRVL